MKQNILIVDDEKNTREGLKLILDNKNYNILLAEDGEKAKEILADENIDLVITDLKMPKVDGMELIDYIKTNSPDTETIMLTGHGTIETAVQAMKKGVFDYIIKPVNIDELNLLTERALMKKSMQEENENLKEQLNVKYGFENIIGNSSQMHEIFDKIKKVAPTKANVLIVGESGTGKELLAKAIHHHSPRKIKPFIPINCGALTPTLLESELFGYERGAFTGAFKQKLGRFELANGGTIFLDEISEISPDLQVKLLRVLQEQTFERVGGTQTIKVDVRIISATNSDLKKLMEENRFREDLYYRLNVVQINVPPLRERIGDITLLITKFIEEFCKENNKPILSISPKAMALLQSYNWPGNVRELRNTIEGIVVMTTGKKILPEHLPSEITEHSKENVIKIKAGTPLKEAERELIRATLINAKGNRTKAANMLGLGRKTLYRKIEEYGLSIEIMEKEN